ncbi:MAG: hypothetical protein AB8H79_12870 [Myxococcota bacterium]
MDSSLKQDVNLFDYFHGQVSDAHADLPVELSGDTLLYLTRMLTERARADRPSLPETTLAELHGRAHNGRPEEQVRAYRELGDRSLYTLGCFSEQLDRQIVGRTYYQEMGSAAYWRVDSTIKRWFADAFGPVFRELAMRFEGCVQLLDHVSERHDEAHPNTLLRLFRKWQETGSDEVARRLRAHGVVVPANSLDG